MEEGNGRYAPRPLISFAEDPEPTVISEDWMRQSNYTSKYGKESDYEKGGIRFYRCGGGYRVVRRCRRNY